MDYGLRQAILLLSATTTVRVRYHIVFTGLCVLAETMPDLNDENP